MINVTYVLYLPTVAAFVAPKPKNMICEGLCRIRFELATLSSGAPLRQQLHGQPRHDQGACFKNASRGRALYAKQLRQPRVITRAFTLV